MPSRIGEARVAGSANKVEKVRVYLPLLFRESGCNVLKVGTVRDARQGGGSTCAGSSTGPKSQTSTILAA